MDDIDVKKIVATVALTTLVGCLVKDIYKGTKSLIIASSQNRKEEN